MVTIHDTFVNVVGLVHTLTELSVICSLFTTRLCLLSRICNHCHATFVAYKYRKRKNLKQFSFRDAFLSFLSRVSKTNCKAVKRLQFTITLKQNEIKQNQIFQLSPSLLSTIVSNKQSTTVRNTTFF